MDLNEVLVFTRVVQAGSFTAAARTLGMPKSTVSRKVSALEERLGARLLQRTTRKLGLTDAGRTYFDYGARIVSEVEDAERAIGTLQSTPRGLLRITAGINSTYLGPIVAAYLRRYPEVQIELLCTGRAVDLVEERFDLGIRAGVLADSSLIARSLGSVGWFFVATPAYLDQRGRPRTPDQLARHDVILFGVRQTTVTLRLERDGVTTEVAIATRMLVSDFDIAHAAANGGVGIALLPAFRCVEDLRKRRLERVLSRWTAPAVPVHVVYPTSRYVSPKVRSFVDHLHEHMTPPPWELGPREKTQ